jgi:glycine cleavage system H protein
MSNTPDNLFYTKEHEWVEVLSDTTVRFGITDYAQGSLGDIVFVALPAVGDTITAGVSCGEVESTKSVSEIYAPVTGVVTEVNEKVETSPELINKDSYKTGWLIAVEISGDISQFSLLSAGDYLQLIQ